MKRTYYLNQKELPTIPVPHDCVKEGYYKRLNNGRITELAKGRFKLEYLYHNVGYCSIIIKLFSGEGIILDAEADYVEFEWIC